MTGNVCLLLVISSLSISCTFSYPEIDKEFLNAHFETAEPDFEVKDEAQRARYHRFMREALYRNNFRSSTVLRERAYTRANEVFIYLVEKYRLDIETNEPVTIRWDIFSNTAGFVLTRENADGRTIHLNEILFLFNYYYFMEETIPHEVAHLIEKELGRAELHDIPHGSVWQIVMRNEVQTDRRFHNLETIWVCKGIHIIFEEEPRNIPFCKRRIQSLSRELLPMF